MRGSKKSIKSDLDRIDALKDEDIDYSEIPDLSALGKEFWDRAVVKRTEPKVQVTIRMDREVLDWFKARGKGYQTQINAVLRAYKEAQGRA
ncbi:MAG: 3-oxoacyl-ACP synthase [Deltaproteobacteria bacterium]|nr:MAG: 3-oxoacyl-ACP synthase [Deltaproteobacteria bacterium]